MLKVKRLARHAQSHWQDMLKVKRLARHAQSQKIGKTNRNLHQVCSKSKDWQDKQK